MKFAIRIVMLGLLAFTWTLATAKAQNKTGNPANPASKQESENKLSFSIPKNWVLDKEAASKLGLYAVLLPEGMKMEEAGRVITIHFQKKDSRVPELATLESYYKQAFDSARKKYPNVEARSWRPSGLDASKVKYLSQELAAKDDTFTPNHLLIIDAGDGYFTIALAAQDVEELNQARYDEFFSSLRVTLAAPLPEPPAGFSWQRLEEVKGAVLGPQGWHFKQQGGRPTLAYFITKENIDREGRYVTGLTIQAMRPPQPRTAEELASALIDGAAQKKVLIRSWKTAKGVFETYGWEFKNLSKDGSVTMAHGRIISNTKTKTFYWCLFESDEANWKEAWKTGEKMIETLMLADDV